MNQMHSEMMEPGPNGKDGGLDGAPSLDSLQQALAEKTLEAQRLQRELDERKRLMQNIRHELKNAFTVVRGLFSVLLQKDQGPGEGLRKDLAVIYYNAETCERLLEDLREASSLKEDKISLTLQSIKAQRLCGVAVESMEWKAQAQGVHMVLEEVPEKKVQADPLRIQQVLHNLLSNALKFTPEGGSISLWAKKDENFMRFCIQDTGPGIAPQDIKRIFERTYRVQGNGKEGHGLGLAISKRIVEAHGGRIWAESQPAGAEGTGTNPVPKGQGSSFYFTLPLSQQQTLSKEAAKKLCHTIRSLVVKSQNDPMAPNDPISRILRSAIQQTMGAVPSKNQSPQEPIVAIVCGAMEGLMVLDKDLAEGSVEVMQAVVDTSDQMGLDHEEMMRWALVGMAQAGQMAPRGTLENIREALEEIYMGLGEVFDHMCQDFPKTPITLRYV